MTMRPPHPRRRPYAAARGFILLEVLVSLTIMGVALAMVLESFTNSLKAARATERISTATVIARELIEKWETSPPETQSIREECGKEYPGFTYELQYDNDTQPDYDSISDLEEGRLAVSRLISLDIYYEPKNKKAPARRMLHVESALSGSERFSEKARKHNMIRFDQ